MKSVNASAQVPGKRTHRYLYLHFPSQPSTCHSSRTKRGEGGGCEHRSASRRWFGLSGRRCAKGTAEKRGPAETRGRSCYYHVETTFALLTFGVQYLYGDFCNSEPNHDVFGEAPHCCQSIRATKAVFQV